MEVGRPVTRVAALVYLSIFLSGIGLWLQKGSKNPARALSFRRGVSWKRAVYDAHLALGAYAVLLLLLMVGTGLYWSFREPYKALVYRVLDGTAAPPKAKSKESDDGKPRLTDLPYSAMLAAMNARFPEPGRVEITFPAEEASSVTVVKVRQAGFWRLPIKDEIAFDVASGEPLQVRPFSSKTRAEQFLSLILAIHTGEAWGAYSLVLWILATALGATLPLTGVVMWGNRMRGRWKSKRHASLRAEAKA
jgi:uncharacterized iron-regulated membrane protein